VVLPAASLTLEVAQKVRVTRVSLSTMEDGSLASLPCPALTSSNYVTWAIRMKV
jgi:hypothetical protein